MLVFLGWREGGGLAGGGLLCTFVITNPKLLFLFKKKKT